MGRISEVIKKYSKEQLETRDAPEGGHGATRDNSLHEGAGVRSAGASAHIPGIGSHGWAGHREPISDHSELGPDDYAALRAYDLILGHSQPGRNDTGDLADRVDEGLIQRLLSRGIIQANGSLTAKGTRLCRELATKHGIERVDSSKGSEDLAARGGRDGKGIPLPPTLTPHVGQDGPVDTADHQAKQILNMDRTGPERQYPLDQGLVTLLSPQDHEAECFRMLKTSILFAPAGPPPRAILITSSNPGDGKSFVAANLAISIAQGPDTPVLLIDCDMRKPTLHRLFGFADSPGLSEYLHDGADLQPLIRKTDAARLHILPAGSIPRNPSELLASERMSSLVNDLTNRHGLFVVIDSPPATMTADPVILAKFVSGIILVSRYGKTRVADVQMVVEKLGRKKITGHVINRYQHSIREYYGYRKYAGYGKAVSAESGEAFADDKIWGAGITRTTKES